MQVTSAFFGYIIAHMPRLKIKEGSKERLVDSGQQFV